MLGKLGGDVAWKYILYGSRNKTSPNLTNNDKLNGFYLEKKKIESASGHLFNKYFTLKLN
jgi:hypothetical protein